ncbi:MAG: hydroxyacylglutathione hydrolase, partial [Bdellovibrionaceae bacterium]|nr:hydroxyacylglutathione hydrolase [Pseudobdellovibrionaceae bacterium]
VLHLPGHTLDHIAWYEPHHGWLFSGDVLFGLGCGRIFEGTLEQAHSSLHRIKQLPPQTKVFCTHEYTEKNLGFCKTFGLKVQKEYEQKILRLRQNSLPTVPLLLSEELASNPFLLTSELRAFGQLRQSRNIF